MCFHIIIPELKMHEEILRETVRKGIKLYFKQQDQKIIENLLEETKLRNRLRDVIVEICLNDNMLLEAAVEARPQAAGVRRTLIRALSRHRRYQQMIPHLEALVLDGTATPREANDLTRILAGLPPLPRSSDADAPMDARFERGSP